MHMWSEIKVYHIVASSDAGRLSLFRVRGALLCAIGASNRGFVSMFLAITTTLECRQLRVSLRKAQRGHLIFLLEIATLKGPIYRQFAGGIRSMRELVGHGQDI
jgi:hypothetical protein